VETLRKSHAFKIPNPEEFHRRICLPLRNSRAKNLYTTDEFHAPQKGGYGY
jgi:hypothetical protein